MHSLLTRIRTAALPVAGLACALVTLEAQRTPVAQFVSFEMFAPLPYLVETAVLLLIALCYSMRPSLRASNSAVLRTVIAAVVVASTWFVLYGSDASGFLLVVQMLYRASTGLLVVMWGERLLSLGARRAALSFAGACLLSGLIVLAFALVDRDAARVAIGVFPLVAGLLFVIARPCAAECSGTLGLERALKLQADKPLPRFACSTKKDFLVAAGLVALPLVCRGPVVSLQASWMPLQGDAAMAAFIQAGIGCGVVLASFIIFLVIKYAWNRSFVLVYEVFVLPVTFLSFYTAQASSELWFLHVLIIDATYKVTLFFIFMTPFLFPEGKRRNVMVPLLVSFAFLIGMRALFAGLYSVLPDSLFVGVSTVVVLATFIGGGALAFAVIQQQAGDRETVVRDAEAEVRASLEERCALVSKRYDLTPREGEILVLLAQSYRAPYIAEKLVVSRSTVKTHMRNLYGKLGVHSQSELLLYLEQEVESIFVDTPKG